MSLFIGGLAVIADRIPMRLRDVSTAQPGPAATTPPGPLADAASWQPVIVVVGCLAAVATVLLAASAWRNRRGGDRR